jgi:mitochondrial fission protein ELM1
MAETERRLLILGDGKPGHENQALAFARHLHYDYDLVPVTFEKRWGKGASYLLDRFGLYPKSLFRADLPQRDYRAVVSAGSETYYANKVLAQQLGCPCAAIMLPRGYRYNFDLIIAQEHDRPPQRTNILSLPINLTWVEPQGLWTPQAGEPCVGLIIGGDSVHGNLDINLLRRRLEQIQQLFPDHRFWLTTSRRTPATVERMLKEFNFDRTLFYSQEKSNPIPDMLQHCAYVFLTADSSSMISEAVSFGQSCVEILAGREDLPAGGKINKMLSNLEQLCCLHFFDGHVGEAAAKIHLADQLAGVSL